MKHPLILHQPNRRKGSYYRKNFIGDVLYYCFIYNDIHITFAKKGRKNTLLSDATADLLLKRGMISESKYDAYKNNISSLFSLDSLKDYDEYSLEDLYRFVTDVRKSSLGSEPLNRLWKAQAMESSCFTFENCLNQEEEIKKAFEDKETLLIALTDPTLYATMISVLNQLDPCEKAIKFITSETNENNLPSAKDLEECLGNRISTAQFTDGVLCTDDLINVKESFLLVFGESGLLDARDLMLPCGIYCCPKGYHASAVAGQLGLDRPAAVFVPAGFSIVDYVPVTQKTRLSYLILAKLVKEFGTDIYALSTEELYARFPQHFFNVYETDVSKVPESTLTPQIPKETKRISMEEYDRLRGVTIKKYLDGFSSCRYFTETFSEEDEGISGKILVHGVCVKKSNRAAVLPCGKSTPLRQKLRQQGKTETAIVSNFLYFLTPKIGVLYNNLRHDRPDEMAKVDNGHMDYLLEYRNGERIETFPLFRKTCIALKENGEFLFFNFRLGGGTLWINDIPLTWKKECVDPDESSILPDVCIFTPYISLPDRDADRETYSKAVGAGRINIVFNQEQISALRDGDVLMPGMGVVISLEEKLGKEICKKLRLSKNEKGYFDAASVRIRVKLDAPEGISEDEWKSVKWSYGGGLSLILNGIGLCDGDHMEEWFEKDGWASPLSRQTQESTLHTLVKHPRTAIGTTKDGELVILVFSGRTSASDGADYSEMCTIARKMVPNIQNLMNVDGGGSAVLGFVRNGSFTELSLPSTSTGSTVGMVRPINTVLYVPLS